MNSVDENVMRDKRQFKRNAHKAVDKAQKEQIGRGIVGNGDE